MAAMNCLQNKTLRGLLQGQLISLLIAGTGIFASILSSESANFPTMMNFLNYALLSSILLRRTTFGKYLLGKLYGDRYERSTDEGSSKGTVEACDDRSTRRDECTPRKLLFWYISGAILDVEANFLVTEAYNYTSITSIMLLDCFTIPCAMVLSYFFLGCRYSKMHYLGVVLCLLGLSCIVMTDALFAPDRQGTSTLLGDCMCLLGSGLYACSNVLEEYMVKYRDRWDYIGAIGGFGSIISFVQMMSVDYPTMRHAKFSPLAIGSTFGFISCLFLMYINTSAFLQYGDSTLFNLSLLTSDVYAVTFSYFFTGTFVHWLYFIAFGLIACGLLLYHSAKPPIQGQTEASPASQRVPSSSDEAGDLDEPSADSDVETPSNNNNSNNNSNNACNPIFTAPRSSQPEALQENVSMPISATPTSRLKLNPVDGSRITLARGRIAGGKFASTYNPISNQRDGEDVDGLEDGQPQKYSPSSSSFVEVELRDDNSSKAASL